MTVVDERRPAESRPDSARGRINPVDALVAVVVLILIPVAFGAYLLFHAPKPKLLSVSPARVYQGHNLRIEIEGTDLRPFMRVSFNVNRAKSFLLGSTKYALVDLPDLPPGSYDVVLYDYAQEVDRLTNGLTVVANATDVELEVTGSFKAVPDSLRGRLAKGAKLPSADNPVAEIDAVGDPVPGDLRVRAGDGTVILPLNGQHDIPAELRIRCYTVREQDGSVGCVVPGPDERASVAPGALVPLSMPPGWVNFQIASVHPIGTAVTVAASVRFIVPSELASRIKVGDVDTNGRTTGQTRAAAIAAIGGTRPATPVESMGKSGPVVGPLSVVSATLTIPVDTGPGGWTYKNGPLKAGAPLSFETSDYVIQGEIMNVAAPPASQSVPQIR